MSDEVMDVLEHGRVVHELAEEGLATEPLVEVDLCVYPDRSKTGRKNAAPPDEMARPMVPPV